MLILLVCRVLLPDLVGYLGTPASCLRICQVHFKHVSLTTLQATSVCDLTRVCILLFVFLLLNQKTQDGVWRPTRGPLVHR